ncbi:MarR family transcriptional regulator [Saliphagus sp. GCM10025308]|uniref:MarR family transcriptional regulator n=1 Tax=Natronosalvus caseinilyticus TaxID=2953747 RepID=UPI0028B08BAC|nr:MarR family transcriptional regulator [Natronosalvus caseinilyticus]
MQTDVRQQSPVAVPPDIESAQAKLIYLSLAVWEGTSVDDLCTELDVEKGAALSILGTLRERGHVERLDGRYRVC